MAPKKWNGKGPAPSKKAALDWAVSQGVDRRKAEQRLNSGSSAVDWGVLARQMVEDYAATGLDPEGKDRGKGRSTRASAAKDPTTPTGEPGQVGIDADLDGTVDEYIDSAIIDGGDEGILLPVTVPAGVNPRDYLPGFNTVGPRLDGKPGSDFYRQQDTLTPLKWSPEQRANLQRELHAIGLYGKKPVRLGTWTEVDQAAYGTLLSYANLEGRTSWSQIQEWKRRPPVELLGQLKGDEQKPTIRVSNPLDIRMAAGNVAASATGGGDTRFVATAAEGYQEQERLAQQGLIADAEAGGGGTVTEAPSMEAYLLDKLRREQPIDVAGYSFVKAFDVFAQMMRGGL